MRSRVDAGPVSLNRPDQAALFPEEGTQKIRDVIALVETEGAWVPSLWRLEVANIPELGVRMGRHCAEASAAMLSILEELPIEMDPLTDLHAWGITLRLARRHRITLYDAAYLEFACRRVLPLATLDRELRNAAKAEGLEVMGSKAGA